MSEVIGKHYLDLDIHQNNYVPFTCKQDNSAEHIYVTIYDNGEHINNLTTLLTSLDVKIETPDSRHLKLSTSDVWQRCKKDDVGAILITSNNISTYRPYILDIAAGEYVRKGTSELITITNDTVEIHLPQSVFLENGKCKGEIILIQDNNQLATMDFQINIIKSVYTDKEIIDDAYTESEVAQLKNYMSEYAKRAKNSASNAKVSEDNASASATIASTKASEASTSAINAANSANSASASASTATSKASSASASATSATTSEANAKTSESNSKTSEINAKQSELNSKKSEENSKTSENNALQSELNAKDSEIKAAKSEDNTSILESNSKEYQLSALSSKEYAKQYMDRAEKAMVDNEKYAKLSQSYATGDASDCLADSDNNTIITDDGDIICFSFYRENEEIDNARYYYEQSKRISMGLSGVLMPMGTITYEELALQTKQSGYMYNISNEFTTDDTFKEGAGFTYPAGTNVYYTYDGYWDCLAGTLVTGIKGRKEIIYRKGNVNITPDDIGALSIEDAALLQTDMDNAKSDISELKTKTTNLQNDVSTNTSDISSLKSDMTTAKTDISNAKTNIANLQTDVGNIQSDVTDLQGDLQDYVNSLLQTISTLQDSVSFLQTMIYTGKALTYLVDDEGENIVTSDGSNIYAWWNIGD